MNLYAFALNDPFLLVDPYGLENEGASGLANFGNNFASGFNHPFDSYGSICGDMSKGLMSSFSADSFSSFYQMSKEFEWKEYLQATSGKVVGIGLAVALMVPNRVISGGIAAFQTGKMFYSGIHSKMSGAFGNVASRFLTRGAASTELRMVMPTAKHAVVAASQSTKLLKFTQGNFRKNLIRLTEVDPGKAAQAHHVFPQKYNKFFRDAGVNIHDPKFSAWWKSTDHLKNARTYNDIWKTYLFESARTENEILDFGRKIMSEYGVPVNY